MWQLYTRQIIYIWSCVLEVLLTNMAHIALFIVMFPHDYAERFNKLVRYYTCFVFLVDIYPTVVSHDTCQKIVIWASVSLISNWESLRAYQKHHWYYGARIFNSQHQLALSWIISINLALLKPACFKHWKWSFWLSSSCREICCSLKPFQLQCFMDYFCLTRDSWPLVSVSPC
jgi:hypothetical protein